MKIYQDINNDSGIRGYDINDDSITVYFKSGGIYLYNYSVTGIHHVNHMINLAQKGNGLNSYINRNVRNRYARKLA